MPDICPVCTEKYDRKKRGTKVTTPKDATVHHKSLDIENGGSVGVWYIHEVGE